jgi:hypothetical protein
VEMNRGGRTRGRRWSVPPSLSLSRAAGDRPVGSTDRNRGAQKRPEGILVYKRLTGGPEPLLRGKYILYVVQSVVSLIFILFFSLAAASL